MEYYVRMGGRDLKILTYPYMGVGDYPCVINEWSLIKTEKLNVGLEVIVGL